jgi:tight adherence protein B
VALTLERMSAVIRDRINFQRQMRATTGAGRFSARMIAVVGPLLFIFMFFGQREHLQPLLSDPLGQMLLILGIVLEVIGIVWVMQLLKNEH